MTALGFVLRMAGREVRASPRRLLLLTTSVAVVRKMLEAVAGSKPRRFSVSGTRAPDRPLMTQLPIMARNTTNASIGACG